MYLVVYGLDHEYNSLVSREGVDAFPISAKTLMLAFSVLAAFKHIIYIYIM